MAAKCRSVLKSICKSMLILLAFAFWTGFVLMLVYSKKLVSCDGAMITVASNSSSNGTQCVDLVSGAILPTHDEYHVGFFVGVGLLTGSIGLMVLSVFLPIFPRVDRRGDVPEVPVVGIPVIVPVGEVMMPHYVLDVVVTAGCEPRGAPSGCEPRGATSGCEPRRDLETGSWKDAESGSEILKSRY